MVVAFCPDLAALERILTAVPDAGRPRPAGSGSAGRSGPPGSSTDLDEATSSASRGLAAGVVDVKVCAVDATWSGLCFMTRLADRAAGTA